MSLDQWRQNGWLQSKPATLPEMLQLFQLVDRDLNDASLSTLSADGRQMFAYSGALTLCNIALRACGYVVPKGGSHHKHTIGSLPLTMGDDFKSLADELDLASRQRSQALYDRAGVFDPRDADELLDTAR